MNNWKFGTVLEVGGGAYVLLYLGRNASGPFQTQEGFTVENGAAFGFVLEAPLGSGGYPKGKTVCIVGEEAWKVVK